MVGDEESRNRSESSRLQEENVCIGQRSLGVCGSGSTLTCTAISMIVAVCPLGKLPYLPVTVTLESL